MLKKLFIAAGMALMTVPAMAQYEKYDGADLTDDMTRYAASYIGSEATDDPGKTVGGYVTMMQMYYNAQSWGEMYENWKWLIQNAPIATVSIYARGAVMLGQLIKAEGATAEQKTQYLNDLMNLFDTRLKYLKYLNASVAEGKRGRATEGDVLIAKANYYHIYAYGIDPEYTYNKIYDMYSLGIQKINEEGGREVKGVYLQYFFSVSYELYKASNEFYREQFLNDYLSSSEVCNKLLQMAKEETDADKAQQIVDEYDRPLAVIEQVFAESGAADRDQLIALYTPKVEENKANLAYLRRAMVVLAQNNCDDTDVYYTAARYAYNIEPTYESAIGMAQISKKEGKMNDMLTYYNKALDLCKTDKQKGRICMNIASSLINSSQFTGAQVYLDRATEYDSDLAGQAYMKKAVVYTSLGQYNEAVQACNQAAAADITVSGSANRLSAKIKSVQANAAANAKARAEYEAYKKKQAEEESFWTKK